MKHLTAADVIDVLDGCATRQAEDHAATCETCRCEVEEAREGLRLTAIDEIPEPSPMYWPVLSDRIREATAQEAANARPRMQWSWRWNPVRLAAVAGLVALVGIGLWNVRPPAAGIGGRTEPPSAAVAANLPDDSWPADDEPWTLLADLVAETPADSLAREGVVPELGSTDRALAALTATERAELAKLLRVELGES